MTIRQQGGVFGRNPDFNDVSANSASFTALTAGASSLGAITGTSFNIAQFKTGTNILESNASGENGARLRAAVSAAAFPTFSFTSDSNTGLYNETADVLGVAVGGVEAGSFTSTGLAFPNGKGIDFSATSGTGTSELFDDYEEGTWTPVIQGSTSDPSATYGLQRGLYTKVGRLVHVSCYLSWSSYSGGSGDALIGGLPFTVESGEGVYGAASIARLDSVTFAASRTFAGLWILSGTTTMRFYSNGSNVTSSVISVSDIGASGLIGFSASYQV